MTTSQADQSSIDERGSRRTVTGTVTSDKMDKTVVVTVVRRIRDRRFHKFVTRRVKYKAHDELNSNRTGDVVELIEARPMSATKRWRVLRTISKSVEIFGDTATTAPAATTATPSKNKKASRTARKA